MELGLISCQYWCYYCVSGEMREDKMTGLNRILNLRTLDYVCIL